MRKYSKTSLPMKLKMLRLESGKSQDDLAKELGISRSCLANYETGKRQPDNEMLVKIADIFHVLTDYLVDRTQYRNFDFSMQEISEFIQMKHMLHNHGAVLDLSVLSKEGKIAVIQYYHYIETLMRLQEEHASQP
ncbi:MAG: helix-turn-helix domain-containing protein [Clostridia bacterium]